MSDFPLVGGGVGILEEGFNFAATTGTTISVTSTDTKGAWVEIVSAAANVNRTEWLFVIIGDVVSKATNSNYLFDIAIGASGSEQIILNNLLAHTSATGTNASSYSYQFPIAIPGGTRIAARMQGTVTGNDYECFIARGRGGIGWNALSQVDTYGATDSGDSRGTTVAITTAHTFGSWVEITASTTAGYKGFVVACCRMANQTSWSSGSVYYQVAVGGSGSEEIFYSGNAMWSSNTSELILGDGAVSHFIPVGIPSGERLSIRAQSTLNNTDMDLDYIIYGVR